MIVKLQGGGLECQFGREKITNMGAVKHIQRVGI